LLIAAIMSGTACSEAGPTPSISKDAIFIGAFEFTEGAILSNLYAQVLSSNGFDVHIEPVATREIMQPGLEQGHIDLVPEYQGTLLRFLRPLIDVGALPDQRDALDEALGTRGLVALQASPGQNQNEIVVTSETASDLDVSEISDLEAIANSLTFGGPPECPARPLCLQGLEDEYGIHFDEFVPLDAGGPLTLAALNGGEIDVGLLFGTDPAIDRDGLEVLVDDQNLQPRENILPVMQENLLDQEGVTISEPLNELSAKLTTETLRDLNSQVDDEGVAPEDAARAWLEEEGLV
jgi:osmoprotectant transport system substrate-binding protein